MKRRLTVIAAAACLGLATAAQASEPKPQPVDSARAEQGPEQRTPPPKPLDSMATDKRESSLTSFDQLDADKNGKLSKSELGADEAAGLEFSKIDRDSDGTISRDEWNAHWAGRQDKH